MLVWLYTFGDLLMVFNLWLFFSPPFILRHANNETQTDFSGIKAESLKVYIPLYLYAGIRLQDNFQIPIMRIACFM